MKRNHQMQQKNNFKGKHHKNKYNNNDYISKIKSKNNHHHNIKESDDYQNFLFYTYNSRRILDIKNNFKLSLFLFLVFSIMTFFAFYVLGGVIGTIYFLSSSFMFFKEKWFLKGKPNFVFDFLKMMKLQNKNKDVIRVVNIEVFQDFKSKVKNEFEKKCYEEILLKNKKIRKPNEKTKKEILLSIKNERQNVNNLITNKLDFSKEYIVEKKKKKNKEYKDTKIGRKELRRKKAEEEKQRIQDIKEQMFEEMIIEND